MGAEESSEGGDGSEGQGLEFHGQGCFRVCVYWMLSKALLAVVLSHVKGAKSYQAGFELLGREFMDWSCEFVQSWDGGG